MARKATAQELTQARSAAEAREAQLQQDLKRESDKALDEVAAQKDLKRERDKALYEAAALRASVRAAWLARTPVMQFGSIAAAIATLGFWTYQLLWSAPQPLLPTTSEPAIAQQSDLQAAVLAADAEAQRKVKEAEQLKEEARRQAKAAADAEAKSQAAEAEQQRLKEELQRQGKAAADLAAKLKTAEAAATAA
jgi:hypothetical protein